MPPAGGVYDGETRVAEGPCVYDSEAGRLELLRPDNPSPANIRKHVGKSDLIISLQQGHIDLSWQMAALSAGCGQVLVRFPSYLSQHCRTADTQMRRWAASAETAPVHVHWGKRRGHKA
ncbi:hypothetical protein GCM10027570_18410 [Streptomonospora sediminis]